jgi:RHS repeat-associated protein
VVELDPWGANTARSSATVFQPQNFTSYTRDLNGDQDAMARRYSPTGRFSQPDPYSGSYDFSDPQSLNRYAYVGNDPVNRRDPSGLAATCTTPDGMSGWVGDDGKCHATVVSDTRAPIFISPLSQRSIVGLISTRGFTGTRDHGGDPGGPNPQHPGANQGELIRQFAYAFQVASNILSQSNACTDFLGGTQAATTILGVLQTSLQLGALPNPFTGISMSVPRPVAGNLQAAGNGFSYRTPADAILNTSGIFYHVSMVGEYISNTLAGQLAQIFHEEAHLTIGPGGMPLIPNDGFSALVSRMNTATVLGHCRAAINAAVATAGPAPGPHLAP